tara:strand:+ start:2445 stop:2612 length:168 start_codon:yes stop_codon:yes gene_type:complete
VNVNWSNRDLSKFNFRVANLSITELSGAHLISADLNNIHLCAVTLPNGKKKHRYC